MRRFFRTVKVAAFIAVLLLTAFLIFMAAAKTFYHPEKYRKQIVDMARTEFGLDLEFGSVELAMYPPGIRVDGVVIKTGGKPIFFANRLEATPSVGSLLKGVPAIRKLRISSPLAFATRGADGEWNFTPVINKILATKSIMGVPDNVMVSNGRLILIDEKAEGGAAAFAFVGVKGTFRKAGWVRPMKVELEADLHDPISPGKIKTSFESWVKAPDWQWKGKWMEGKLRIDSVNGRKFAPYISEYAPEQYLAKKYSGTVGFSGRLNEEIKFKGDVSAFSLNSQSLPADLRRVKFEGNHKPGKVVLDSVEVALPEASVTGTMTVSEYDKESPKLYFRAESSMIDIAKLAKLVPPQYKDAPVVRFVESSVLDGSFRLSDVRFDGPAKSFVNLKNPDNLRMLTGNIEVKSLGIKGDWMTRKITGVGGKLTLNGVDMVFDLYSGAYGGSSVKNISGKVSDIFGEPVVVATCSADLNLAELRSEILSRIKSARLNEIVSPIKNVVGNVDVGFKAEFGLNKHDIRALDGVMKIKNVGFVHDKYKATIEGGGRRGRVHKRRCRRKEGRPCRQ